MTDIEPAKKNTAQKVPEPADERTAEVGTERAVEVGGRDGPEPTRYGDWEKNGICSDF